MKFEEIRPIDPEGILYPRPRKIDGKEEARKALSKVHGKTKKHETTNNYLTIQLTEGTKLEWAGDSFLIKGPFTCKIINKNTIRIQNKRGLDNGK